MIKKFLESLGINTTRLEWKIRIWKNRIFGQSRGAYEKASNTFYLNKMCESCNALIAHDENPCPFCGHKTGSYFSQILKRWTKLTLPKNWPATYILIAANILVFALMILFFGLGPLIWPQNLAPLARMGGIVPIYIKIYGEIWRFITAGYLHIGIIHLGFNMLALYQIGPVIESRIKWERFFSMYTFSLITSSLASYMWRSPAEINVLSAGASGAIFGLLGFGVAFEHFYGTPSGRFRRNFFLQWALYGFLFGMMTGMADNAGHFGGFVGGAIMGFLIEKDLRFRHKFDFLWKIVAGVCLLITLASYVALVWY